jgi:NADPH:quinone reductase-like Zn-dependent oxidoreductase
MKAMVYDRYGPPDVLELRDVDEPELADDGVLVRVHASSVNPYDWHMLTGVPYLARTSAGLRRPKTGRLGVDFAGTVEAVGKDAEGFRPGDEVFGARNGAFAEYVSVRNAIAHKPPKLTFAEAAAVPLAAITALQGLRDKGRIQPGHQVLINGASGGVGTFAVQLAKAFGAEVTAVCSTKNVDTARARGADDVVDYTRADFTRRGRRYDLVLDIGGNRSWSESKRVLKDGGSMVLVGGPKANRWVGPMASRVGMSLVSRLGSRRARMFLAKTNRADLEILQGLLADGKLKPVIEKQYELGDLPAALRYVGTGHARAKVVIVVRP